MRTKAILQISKSRLLTFGFAIFVNVILAGSVCGTFAWYTYATRTGFEKEYHGTTVGDMGSLQAGIISEVRLSDYTNYELTEDSTTLLSEGKYIYWCKEIVKAETINYVISNNGSATTQMYPVTSASYDDFDNPNSFQLYRDPTPKNNYTVGNSNDYAASFNYVYIPFLFRYEDEDHPGQYLANQVIHMTHCNVETTVEDKELYKSVRVYANNGEHGYLINPTAEQDGVTKVGGILDLDRDGFYDYKDDYEFIYGESIASNYLDDPTESSGTIPEDEITSFVANHKRGVYALDEDNYQAKTVSYHSLSKFTSKEVSITTTTESYYNMAKCFLTIYFEGWDQHVVNKELGSGFNLDLEFEIDI